MWMWMWRLTFDWIGKVSCEEGIMERGEGAKGGEGGRVPAGD